VVASTEPLLIEMIGPQFVITIICWWLGLLCWLGLFPYGEELRGIAKTTNLPVGKLALIQMVYEASAACTSVVVDDEASGHPVHLRTMDW